jgi:hypothetical protein
MVVDAAMVRVRLVAMGWSVNRVRNPRCAEMSRNVNRVQIRARPRCAEMFRNVKRLPR